MGVAAGILGIVAAALGFFATFLFGTVGGIVAGVFAVLAIVLGILKKKKEGKGGIAGTVIGAVALVLTISLTAFWSGAFKEMHKKAVQYKPDGLWAKVTEKTDGGMMGIIKQLPTDEASINALLQEMEELNKLGETK